MIKEAKKEKDLEKTENNKEKEEKKSSWIKMKKEDVEKLVVSLAKEGRSSAQIGLELRDKHGIPKIKLFGKRISEILSEKGIEYKTEKHFVEKRVSNLRRHIDKNKKDYPASRALTKKLWVIKNLN
ncbi:30S ribosomal protein S15 [Candidatus Pacearchaeota archaeon]|nr:30S ribosomal protein S15 [Candidatus Pacearchaeota archaeon]